MSLVEWQKSLRLAVQGRSFTPVELYEVAAMCAGGKANDGYFRLLELQISEFFFHVEVISRVMERSRPKQEKAGVYGGDIDWE
jgi:hypothetical protein